MSDAITPVVNAIITIQPLGRDVGRQEVGAMQTVLATLTDGTLVRGYVVNRDRNNNPVLRTEMGDLVVESEMFLKTGSDVVLRVDASQASRARIVTIDELTPDEYSIQAAARGLTEDTIAQSPLKATAAGGTDAAQGTAQTRPVVQAIVLQALGQLPGGVSPATAATATPVPPALNALAAGTPVTLTITDVKLPPLPVSLQQIPAASDALSQLLPKNLAVAAPPVSTPPATDLSPGSNPAPPSNSAQPALTQTAAYAASQSALQSPSTAMPAAVTAALAAAQTQPSAVTVASVASFPSLALAATLEATVIGHGEDGSNILHTAFATLKMFTTQPLPTGTVLQVAVQAEAAPATADPLAQFPGLLPRLPTAAPDFVYLSQALARLYPGDPTVARELLSHLPTIGPKFTSGLLFFLTAVKHGNMRELLSARLIAQLDTLAPELLTRLGRDVATLHQQQADPPQGDWKTIPLPLVFGSSAEAATLYIRKDPGGGQPGAERTVIGQRFLLDIDFSELGPMQFDGFIRHEAPAKSLELFLRSAAALDPVFSGEIRSLFDNALQTTGLKGQIVFQAGAERFVKPQALITAPLAGGGHTILA